MRSSAAPALPDDIDLIVPRRRDEPVMLRLLAAAPTHPRGEGHDILAVFVGQKASLHDGRLPVAGRYEREGDTVRFLPMFGFAAGQDYVVRIRCNGESPRFTEFRIDAQAAAPRARVTAVYPSGDALPENVLRFYVHFSVPMAPHRASDFIRLRDARGLSDDAAFMQFKQELWNQDRTRLTILLDPGRIKRGVTTNLRLGPALLEGHRYALTLEGGWPSADGSSQLPAYSKNFGVTAPLREQPRVGLWAWTPPTSGTRDALRIQFDRPFDRHALRGAIQIAASDGRILSGTSQVGDDESSWSFTPDDAWPSSDVQLIVDEALEDVAGNNLRELLDRDVGATENSRASHEKG
ncbi:MAG: hypothetical protein ACE366_14305 [Bradymonadia bacterium]